MKIIKLIVAFLLHFSSIVFSQAPVDYRDFTCGVYESYLGNCSINIPPNDPYGVGQTVYIRVDKSNSSLDSIVITDSSLYYDSHFISYAKLNIDSTWQSDNLYFGNFKKQDTLQRSYVVFPGPTLCYKYAKKISPIGIYSLNNREKEWYLYPNPTKNDLNILLPSNTEEINLQLLDLNSKLIAEKKFRHNTQLDVGNLPRGIYLIKIQGKGFVLSKRVVLVE